MTPRDAKGRPIAVGDPVRIARQRLCPESHQAARCRGTITAIRDAASVNVDWGEWGFWLAPVHLAAWLEVSR